MSKGYLEPHLTPILDESYGTFLQKWVVRQVRTVHPKGRRQELVASGDTAQIEVEIKALLREIHSTQKHADELEASRDTCSKAAWG